MPDKFGPNFGGRFQLALMLQQQTFTCCCENLDLVMPQLMGDSWMQHM